MPKGLDASVARPYALVRSRRKTLAIYITREATVEVRAPLHMPVGYIDRFVASKEAWIITHLHRREAARDAKAAFSLDYGDTIQIAGQARPITAREGGRAGFDGDVVYFPPGLAPAQIKSEVVTLYRRMAKQHLADRIAVYAAQMGVAPTGFRVTGAKTRWGSCSAKKSLNFSWRLMMADLDVIDYVVVHELAHIFELNHSPRFWAHVEQAMPDYHVHKAKLKQLQEVLAWQDWD